MTQLGKRRFHIRVFTVHEIAEVVGKVLQSLGFFLDRVVW